MKKSALIITIISFLLNAAAPACYAQGFNYGPQVPGLVTSPMGGSSPAAMGGFNPNAGYPAAGNPYDVSGNTFSQSMPGQMSQINMQTQVPYQGGGSMPGQNAQWSQGNFDNHAYTPTLQDSSSPPPDMQKLSPYQQQEAALQQASLTEQITDLKQKKEIEDSYKGGVSNGSGSGKPHKESKFKGAGTSFKNGLLKYGAPAAGVVGSVFLMRAAFRGMPMMAPGGMMVMPPGSMVVMPR